MILKILIKDNLLKYLVDVLKLANKTCERNLYGAIGHSDRCVNELILLKGLFWVFIYILYTLKTCGYHLTSQMLYRCIVENKLTNFPSFFAVYLDFTLMKKVMNELIYCFECSASFIS